MASNPERTNLVKNPAKGIEVFKAVKAEPPRDIDMYYGCQYTVRVWDNIGPHYRAIMCGRRIDPEDGKHQMFCLHHQGMVKKRLPNPIVISEDHECYDEYKDLRIDGEGCKHVARAKNNGSEISFAVVDKDYDAENTKSIHSEHIFSYLRCCKRRVMGVNNTYSRFCEYHEKINIQKQRSKYIENLGLNGIGLELANRVMDLFYEKVPEFIERKEMSNGVKMLSPYIFSSLTAAERGIVLSAYIKARPVFHNMMINAMQSMGLAYVSPSATWANRVAGYDPSSVLQSVAAPTAQPAAAQQETQPTPEAQPAQQETEPAAQPTEQAIPVTTQSVEQETESAAQPVQQPVLQSRVVEAQIVSGSQSHAVTMNNFSISKTTVEGRPAWNVSCTIVQDEMPMKIIQMFDSLRKDDRQLPPARQAPALPMLHYYQPGYDHNYHEYTYNGPYYHA